MECRHVIDAGGDEKGNACFLKITAPCEKPAGELRDEALDLCEGKGIVIFDQSNLGGPVAVQYVVHRRSQV